MQSIYCRHERPITQSVTLVMLNQESPPECLITTGDQDYLLLKLI